MIKRYTALIFLLVFLVTSPITIAGEITGTVTIISAQTVAPASSPFARKRSPNPSSSQVKTESQKAVVYLEDHPNFPLDDSPHHATMNQQDMEIVPHILPVVVGTTVSFPNSDNLYHNLFSLSSTKRFDLGRYSMGKSKDVRFDRQGEVQVFCDIHPHMNGIILVLPNSKYTLPDSEGLFSISDIPPGDYKVNVWHEQYGIQSKNITVEDGKTVEINFVLGRN